MKLLQSLFRRPVATARTYALPTGVRAYAIGDVHGRRDLLEALLARIDAERAASPRPHEHLILLGDLVDRGPDSRGVIDLVLARRAHEQRMTVLCGNHEEMLIEIANGAHEHLEQWLHFGGEEYAASYGLDPVALLADRENAPNALRTAIPPEHWAFLTGLPNQFQLGDFLFVHAGIRPGIPIQAQVPRDLRWIRDVFLRSTEDHGAMVVHGHTVTEAPEDLPNRIGIDTGAYATGRLTALCIDGAKRSFLATDPAA